MPRSLPKIKRRPTLLFAGLVVFVVAVSFTITLQLPEPTGHGIYTGYPQRLRNDYAKLQYDAHTFQDAQANADAILVSKHTMQGLLSDIQLLAASGNYIAAETKIKQLQTQLAAWRSQLNSIGANQLAATEAPATGAAENAAMRFLPILIYHYTPPDFEAQLTYLENHNYQVIGLDTAAAAFSHGTPLPQKPVVITFDDGFKNQLTAFEILKQHHMRATFYIINGGAASQWCIGAGRRYNDPLQPPSGCGDSYMDWNDVRELDRSGLITIGGHTLDHPLLATLPRDEQQREISDSKTQIEREIGHPIYDFAYPYGNYDQTTIDLVGAAGYRTAVTTAENLYQYPGSLHTLSRIRSVYQLP